MAKITTETIDGWPVMQPLGKKESALLTSHLLEGEQVLGQVIGNFGQAAIATAHKLIVVKTGMMSGQSFGGKATTFDYRTVSGIEVRTGFTQGEFAVIAAGLLAPGQRNSVGSKVNIAEQPNGIVFQKQDADKFNAFAAKVRELVSHNLGPSNAQPEATIASTDDVFETLRKLGELRDAGIVTGDEFETKKAELLGRI
ncbi:SHOCT domain-containing protein [Humibacter antri]